MVDDLRARVRAALERHGLREVAARLDIPPESVLRLSTGQRTRRVTESLARLNAHRLDDQGAHAS